MLSCPQVGTDSPLLDDIDGCGQCAGTQKQGQITGLAGTVQTGCLKAPPEGFQDIGYADHFLDGNLARYFFTVHIPGFGPGFYEDHRHRLTDVFGGDVAHAACALPVQADENRRLTGTLIKA